MLSESEQFQLHLRLRESWPPYDRWLSEKDTRNAILYIDNLIDLESKSSSGQFAYFHSKLKIHADHYGLNYSIPSEYLESCKSMMNGELRMKKKGWWPF